MAHFAASSKSCSWDTHRALKKKEVDIIAINSMYKVGIYCRLSLDDGNKGESNSIQTQKIILEKYVKENHLNLEEVYIDDGYSGLKFDRPSFQRMLSDIENKKINMVVTKDLSRLGRDYILLHGYIFS